VRFNSSHIVTPDWEGYWLDPRDKKAFGPDTVIFEKNIAEAKKLLSAAGVASGFDTALMFATGDPTGGDITKKATIASGMLTEAGIRANLVAVPYPDSWLNDHYQDKFGNYDGALVFKGNARYAFSIPASMRSDYHKDGGTFRGMSPNGLNPEQGDPYVNSTVEKIQQEFETERQQALVHELVKYLAKKSYYVQLGFYFLPLSLDWPAIGNNGLWRTYQGGSAVPETQIHWWIDQSQPPIAKKA
jgi:hypothetical protein